MTKGASLVALPTRMTSSPDASGSKVPVCPVFTPPRIFLMAATISGEVGPVGLSTRSSPSVLAGSEGLTGILECIQEILEASFDILIRSVTGSQSMPATTHQPGYGTHLVILACSQAHAHTAVLQLF